MKTCKTCNIDKKTKEFPKYSSNNGGGPQAHCKECCAKKRAIEYLDPLNWVNKTCVQCDQEFSVHKNNGSRTIHCSRTCASKTREEKRDRDGSLNPNWRGGKRSHPLYFIYHAMIARCHRPTDKSYENYGGRGIYVCDSWREDFWKFVDDIGPRPTDQKYYLDRIDNDGPYAPENCKWSTGSESVTNRRPSAWSNNYKDPKTGKFTKRSQ